MLHSMMQLWQQSWPQPLLVVNQISQFPIKSGKTDMPAQSTPRAHVA